MSDSTLSLAALRRAAGFPTQPDLAAASGVSRATIANLERGEFGDVKLSTIDALAAALRVDRVRVSDAIGRPQPARRKPPKRHEPPRRRRSA